MWLDRLSSNSTPSGSPPPSNRGLTQPPKRNANQLGTNAVPQRPGFNPRSSSLSLVSNDSTTSLLSSSHKRNGSAIRQPTAVTDAPDPLVVLGKLLDLKEGLTHSSKPREVTGVDGIIENELELDFGGLSLRELVLGKSFVDEKENTYKSQTVEECMSPSPEPFTSAILMGKPDELDKEKFEDLHRSIRACDDVLSSVETNLTSFQNDLATVSAEIETLQGRSTALSVRLENRKVVENGLGPIVEEISISPAVVRKVVEGAIDEAWVRALAEVEKRSKAMDAKSKEFRNIKGISDLNPMLENLIDKVSIFQFL